VSDFLTDALGALSAKPGDGATQAEKKRYSELLSQGVALAFAAELRRRGLTEARPDTAVAGGAGAERRMAGGIGAKKVDVTWATEESGLLLGVSVKSINFKDGATGNYQKNLTNRRGDMLFEAVTLHRRFPYAVLVGFFFFDHGAARDVVTETRKSTFLNAHKRLQLFTGRNDPAGRDEQFERLYVVLHDATPGSPSAQVFLAGHPDEPLSLTEELDLWLNLVSERNPDFYESINGQLKKLR
jgi:hypothetical protein